MIFGLRVLHLSNMLFYILLNVVKVTLNVGKAGRCPKLLFYEKYLCFNVRAKLVVKTTLFALISQFVCL